MTANNTDKKETSQKEEWNIIFISTCDICHGVGELYEGDECPNCQGKGETYGLLKNHNITNVVSNIINNLE